MPSERTPESIVVRLAGPGDIAACKRIADAYRDVFGFLTRGVFREAAERGKLLVATSPLEEVLGFVRFNHRRRDQVTVLYDIAADLAERRCGVGRALVRALADAAVSEGRSVIMLRCPEGAEANHFYAALGFSADEIEQGRRRRLIRWRLVLGGARAAEA